MRYEIHCLPDGLGPLTLNGEFFPAALPAAFSALSEAKIENYPWLAAYPHRFPAAARVGWNESGLIVLLYAEEAPVQAKETVVGGMPCHDSCLEFFLMPAPDRDQTYVNVEVNPIGTPHVGFGAGRHARRVYGHSVPDMDISVSAPGAFWAVSYRLPAALLRAEFGVVLAPGQTMRGNFYKCCEDIHPHFGAWNPVETARPDFHRPEFFGEMILL